MCVCIDCVKCLLQSDREREGDRVCEREGERRKGVCGCGDCSKLRHCYNKIMAFIHSLSPLHMQPVAHPHQPTLVPPPWWPNPLRHKQFKKPQTCLHLSRNSICTSPLHTSLPQAFCFFAFMCHAILRCLLIPLSPSPCHPLPLSWLLL